MTPRPDSLLWWRAGIVAAMIFLLGAVGHASAGGLLPSWWTLAAMLAVGTTICAVVLARTVSAVRIMGLVVVGQTVCHGVLSLTAGHAGDPTATAAPLAGPGDLPLSGGARVGSLQDHYDAMVATSSTGAGLTIPDPAALLDHLPMFAAHTVVALLVGLWLVAGERALWTSLSLVFTAVIALLTAPRAVAIIAPGTAPVRRRPATPPSLARVARIVVRRGPPVLLAV